MPYKVRPIRHCERCGKAGTYQNRIRLERGHILCPACRGDFNVSLPKTCKTCGETKDAAEFYIAKTGERRTLSASCKMCTRDYANEQRFVYKYGITRADIRAMAAAQDNRCLICRHERPLCVDHCHSGGEVRGLLCAMCNKGLGHFQDDPDRLFAAALYLLESKEVKRADEVA